MVALFVVAAFVFALSPAFGAGGFQLQPGRTHTSVPFQTYKDVIIVPAIINDTVPVRLILDTGTRSILLCGKRFAGMQNLSSRRKVGITGWGSPKPIDAAVSYPNTIEIGHVRGEALAFAVVPERHLFAGRPDIDGIIGYELFAKFIVEINYDTEVLQLFEKLPYGYASDFVKIPLEVNKAMPQIASTVVLNNKTTVQVKLLVDTGSSLGLALFTKEKFLEFSSHRLQSVGIGLNGPIHGYDLYCKRIMLGNLRVKQIPTHVIDIDEHPDETFSYCGSIGAAFLRKHVVIFDYPGERLLLKPI